VQFAVSVTLLPAVGDQLDGASVQLGATPFQSTETAAGDELPPAFVPTTAYVADPGVEFVVVHTLVVDVQFDQAYDVGEFVQLAVSVTLPPTVCEPALALTAHDGAGGGATGATHVTPTLAGALLPPELVATTP
jgi:hypothetical protein